MQVPFVQVPFVQVPFVQVQVRLRLQIKIHVSDTSCILSYVFDGS